MSSDLDRDGSGGALPFDGINPAALIVPVLIVGVAALLLVGRRRSPVATAGASAGDKAARARRAARNSPRRMVLTMLINALENDAARRGVIMALKMVRSRL